MKSFLALILTTLFFSLLPKPLNAASDEGKYPLTQEAAKLTNTVPVNFLRYRVQLIDAIKGTWGDIERPTIIAGLMEQETCYNLKHSKCFSPLAELKTSREYGFGLGQLTVTAKFNAFDEARQLDSRLKNWEWEDRYNVDYQMIAVIRMMKRNYGIFSCAHGVDRFAFAAASYNGGIGGIQQDQRVCRNVTGCDPCKWFGNVEKYSLKAKTAQKGYGKSFFEINREHARNTTLIRPVKYVPFIDPYFVEDDPK